MGLKLVRRNKKVEKPPRTGAGPDWAYPMVLSRQVLKKIKNKKQSGSNPKKIKKSVVEKPPRTGMAAPTKKTAPTPVQKKPSLYDQMIKPPKKIKKWNLKGGGDFDIELKIPKEMVNQGVMYGYKKGGQV